MQYTVYTTFKNKSDTFFSFQNFYSKYWNAKQFCYFIGYTSEENKNYILNHYFKDEQFQTRNFKNTTIKDLVSNVVGYYNKKYYVVLYKTKEKNTIDEWNEIKNGMSKIIRAQYYKHFKIDRLIAVDDDEFLYTKDPQKIGSKHRFHFIEFIPPDGEFDSKNMEWSTQGWSHCHCLYTEQGNPEKTYKCSGCKRYGFDKADHWDDYMCHGGDNLNDSSVCKKFTLIKDKSSVSDQELIDLFKDNVCFHFIGLTKQRLKQTKQVNRFDVQNKRGNWRSDLFQDTNALIKKNIRWFKWNFLADIIDEKDLKIIELKDVEENKNEQKISENSKKKRVLRKRIV